MAAEAEAAGPGNLRGMLRMLRASWRIRQAAAWVVALSALVSAPDARAQAVTRDQRQLVRPASDTLPREPWGRRQGEPPPSERRFEEVRRYGAPEARQGVAADADHFYAVGNRVVAKYDRATGARMAVWQGADDGPIVHLNSCIVLDERLVCAHSNHPGIPMLSSLEIFDPETLEPIGSRSLGAYEGSLTWAIRHDGSWWLHFAHYANYSGTPGKGPEWSTLVRFDDDWRRTAAYAYPVSLVERFTPDSSSGGNWGPDGRLYVTGHAAAEVYVLELPAMGSVLEWVETIPAPMEGQAWVFDPADPDQVFGIVRATGEVVVGTLR